LVIARERKSMRTNQGCFEHTNTKPAAEDSPPPKSSEIVLVVTGPESKRREWHMTGVARVKFEEQQGDSCLFTCTDRDMEFVVRMARACDVTLQVATFGETEYGPLAVEHSLLVTVAKYSWETYEVIHLGSDEWKWGLIRDNGRVDMGTVRPRAAATPESCCGARPRNGRVEPEKASGQQVQD